MNPAVPQSQDHQVFAQHSFGTLTAPKECMSNTEKSAAAETAVETKHAATKAAKQQAVAEQAKQKTKAKKQVAAQDKAAVVAEQLALSDDAVPAEATKEEATVQIWPGLAPLCDSTCLSGVGLGLGYGWAPPVNSTQSLEAHRPPVVLRAPWPLQP